MRTLLRYCLFLPFLAAAVFAAAPVRKLGVVDVAVDKDAIAVRVSSNNPELNSLAIIAFRSHGRYIVRATDYSYDLRFTHLGGNQVKLDILRGRENAIAFSETVSGTSPRNALLRAADIAVGKTNGLGLRGFFTARLAFVGEGSGKKEIYVSDLFMGEAKRVTNDRALVLSPRWSPDGSRLVYTSYFQSGFPDIYMINMRSFDRSIYARFKGTNSGARFSPNGQQIAMVLSSSGTPEIWVGGAQGGLPVRRTRSDAVKSSPCWSPDGAQLVFAMEPGPQLYVMPAAGGTPRRLATGYRYTAEPDWSRAKPNLIACTVREGSRFQVAVYDSSKGSAQIVSQAAFDGIEPSWLADGRHLLYTARDRTTSVLCILDTETGRSTPITTNSGPIGSAMQASVLNAN
ncbi:PD40 domain-containing protein [Opitutus sp. ER46]|uniref:PD40 domain-containing protein n=1 Tax=Opitutus sp. ER46 TaxID=2161864 RepID=UPI000D323780|nr:PD40 domain-containing protein [Opitutus sp. ER46]PTX97767.1 biopolymer transporter Tol [Opitutus sp. ER46]